MSVPTMVWFVFVIALFNFWLGYTLAVQFWLTPSADPAATHRLFGVPGQERFLADRNTGLPALPSACDTGAVLDACRRLSRQLDLKVADLQHRLSQAGTTDTPGLMKHLATDLQETCHALLTEIQSIEQRSRDLSSTAGEIIEDSCMELSAQLETARSNLEHMQRAEHNECGQRQLHSEFDSLAAAARRLVDRLDVLAAHTPA